MSFSNKDKTNKSTWLGSLAVLPGIGAALLPALTCPACWPAYAGLLSSMGIGFLDYSPWLLPLTLVFLFVALAALAHKGIKQKLWGPFILGLVGSVLLVVGKYVFSIDVLLYIGVILLVIGSAWNAWPKKVCTAKSCETSN
ncbi:hypothetical protein MNBD_GAMMA07-880 [hydrothermal vent metagenome]|uniref:Mercuric transport protein, MerC n=1 Tax=hydrothermal vent metagenome TaxID=652676 RepID=A0A3B0WLE8_9ZZZZ